MGISFSTESAPTAADAKQKKDLTRSPMISQNFSFVKFGHQLRQEGPLTRWVGNRCELPVATVLPLTLPCVGGHLFHLAYGHGVTMHTQTHASRGPAPSRGACASSPRRVPGNARACVVA